MGTIAENVDMGGISRSVTRAESLGLSPLESKCFLELGGELLAEKYRLNDHITHRLFTLRSVMLFLFIISCFYQFILIKLT
jgi:hypothetical protein